jgi:predicted secreted acid phosphatase
MKRNTKAYQRHEVFTTLRPKLFRLLEKSNPETSAIVLDIDATILYNTKKTNFCDGALPNPLIMDVYSKALEKNIAVYFVTARRESESNYAWTTKQLKCIGADKYAQLRMRPESYNTAAKVSKFKLAARRAIKKESKRTIILNVGDQWTDLVSINNNNEIDALINLDNKSYWFFKPANNEVEWALKLPDPFDWASC